MTNDQHISFSALDIEKYHKGLLSPKEMHDLEKAALDDPFLADALEGYSVAGVQVSSDLADLQKRLADRTTETKVIPMGGGDQRKAFPWFRVAAAVVILVGAALLANQFVFHKKAENIAEVNTQNPVENKVVNAPADTAKVNGTLNNGSNPVTSKETTGNSTASTDKVSTNNDVVINNSNGGGNLKDNNAVTETKPAAGQTIPPTATAVVTTQTPNPVTKERNEVAPPVNGYISDAKKAADRNQWNSKVADQEKLKDAAVAADEVNASNNRNGVAIARKADEQNYRNQRNNVFRGRVTDANNVGVPFANVTNIEDNAGTYTDAKGNFILTSPDSVMTVQVKSIGFDNTNVQLRNAAPTNQVILQDDRKSLSEVVVSNQKPNAAARSRDANKTLQEPEPADGWDNYDTYIANNLDVPEELKSKQNGASPGSSSVQVSFEVDKNGEPTNIKVEKSLCSSCDKEAIRLIKEGPKWKRNANKKGRTTVTINF